MNVKNLVSKRSNLVCATSRTRYWARFGIACASVAACGVPSPSQSTRDTTATGGLQQLDTDGAGGDMTGGGATVAGGASSSGGAQNDESTSTGGAGFEIPDPVDDPSGGSAGTIVPWPSDEVRVTIASYCTLNCQSLENAQECSDGDNDGELGHGESCKDECKEYYFTIPLACEDELDDYFQCLMMNRGYFDVHCEGDKIVRQDTTSCTDSQAATQACIDVNQ